MIITHTDYEGLAAIVMEDECLRAVVIPGTRKKQFPAGEFELPAALIIGERSSSTDEKTSLNDTLREFAL